LRRHIQQRVNAEITLSQSLYLKTKNGKYKMISTTQQISLASAPIKKLQVNGKKKNQMGPAQIVHK
jgi:hypothetical protein